MFWNSLKTWDPYFNVKLFLKSMSASHEQIQQNKNSNSIHSNLKKEKGMEKRKKYLVKNFEKLMSGTYLNINNFQENMQHYKKFQEL